MPADFYCRTRSQPQLHDDSAQPRRHPNLILFCVLSVCVALYCIRVSPRLFVYLTFTEKGENDGRLMKSPILETKNEGYELQAEEHYAMQVIRNDVLFNSSILKIAHN